MYLRMTKRKNKDGSEVEYYQLAETVYNRDRKRPEAKIIHNFGRVDQLDKAVLQRLAASILRVCEEPELAEGQGGRVGEIEVEETRSYGPVYVAERLWEELGIGEALRARMAARRCRVPHDRLLLALTANRLEAPCSKLACHEHWLQEEVNLPEAADWKLEQLYRALDFLLEEADGIEKEVFFRVADLFNADVDLIFWDTTNFWCEIDEEDEDEESWRGQDFPALRKRGHNKEGRDGQPQVAVGLALTRDGLPVRSWVFPGNTVDVTTVAKVKEDLRGWRLGRCVFVGDAGMYSTENKEALSKGLGRYILAVPMRKVKEIEQEVLTRPGRYRQVRPNLEVKEVVVGDGERRRRYLLCRNLEEAAREKSHRERLLELLRAEIATLGRRRTDEDDESVDEACEPPIDEPATAASEPEKAHPKRVCELLSSRRFGKYLRRDGRGGLEIDEAKVKREERLDGKFVLTTNDDTLSPEDAALGYKSMMIIEGCFRRMKTAGLRTRPLFHWTAHRIVAHIKLCVLALTLQWAAEIRCQDSWRNIFLELRRIRSVRYTTGGQTIVQTTKPTAEALAYLEKLRISPPRKILDISR
jgi:hypothetical protein